MVFSASPIVDNTISDGHPDGGATSNFGAEQVVHAATADKPSTATTPQAPQFASSAVSKEQTGAAVLDGNSRVEGSRASARAGQTAAATASAAAVPQWEVAASQPSAMVGMPCSACALAGGCTTGCEQCMECLFLPEYPSVSPERRQLLHDNQLGLFASRFNVSSSLPPDQALASQLANLPNGSKPSATSVVLQLNGLADSLEESSVGDANDLAAWDTASTAALPAAPDPRFPEGCSGERSKRRASRKDPAVRAQRPERVESHTETLLTADPAQQAQQPQPQPQPQMPAQVQQANVEQQLQQLMLYAQHVREVQEQAGGSTGGNAGGTPAPAGLDDAQHAQELGAPGDCEVGPPAQQWLPPQLGKPFTFTLTHKVSAKVQANIKRPRRRYMQGGGVGKSQGGEPGQRDMAVHPLAQVGCPLGTYAFSPRESGHWVVESAQRSPRVVVL
jgi:hypothetical protein